MSLKDSAPQIPPFDSRLLWKLVTIIGSIVAATFWVVDKVDSRIESQMKQIRKPAESCSDQNNRILEQIRQVRQDVTSILYYRRDEDGYHRNPGRE